MDRALAMLALDSNFGECRLGVHGYGLKRPSEFEPRPHCEIRFAELSPNLVAIFTSNLGECRSRLHGSIGERLFS